MNATPPVIADCDRFRRNNAGIVAFAMILAGAGQPGTAIFLGGLGLFWNAEWHGRTFSYRALCGLVAFFAGMLVHQWPDVKQGFVEGFQQGRSLF